MWFKILLSCYSIIVRIMSRKEKNSREQNSISRDFPGGPVVKTLPSSAGGVGSIPGQEVKIPQDPTGLVAKNPKIYNRQKQYCNKLNKQFKNGPHKKTT